MAIPNGIYLIQSLDLPTSGGAALTNKTGIRSRAETITPTLGASGEMLSVAYGFGAVGTLTDRAIYGDSSTSIPLLYTRDQTNINLSADTMYDSYGQPLEESAIAEQNVINIAGQPTQTKYYLPGGKTQRVDYVWGNSTATIPSLVTRQPVQTPAKAYTATYSTLSAARGASITITYTIPANTPAFTITPSVLHGSGAGGTFTPATVSVAANATSATCTFTPAVDGNVGIIHSNDGGHLDALPQIVAVLNAPQYATGYTLTVSGAAEPGNTLTYTMTAQGGNWAPGTTFQPRILAGGGTISASTINPATATTATFTISGITAGVLEVDTLNNRGMTNPAPSVVSVQSAFGWTLVGASTRVGNAIALPPPTSGDTNGVVSALISATANEIVLARDSEFWKTEHWFLMDTIARSTIDPNYQYPVTLRIAYSGIQVKGSAGANLYSGDAYSYTKIRKSGANTIISRGYELNGSIVYEDLYTMPVSVFDGNHYVSLLRRYAPDNSGNHPGVATTVTTYLA